MSDTTLPPTVAAPSLHLGAEARDWFAILKPWYDRDIDRLMHRTARRPVATGRIAPNDALGFGIVLSVASVLLMWLATNAVAAILLAASIAFYVLIYTMWLKRLTPQNIVIGGAAGAFPPLIGWAAVTGSIGTLPLILFAIVFFWTPPHFWALSLYACKDYARAGVPMLPVTHGAAHTRRQITLYTVLLVGVSLLPVGLHLTGSIYAVVALALGLGFLGCSWRVLRDRQDGSGVSLTNDRPARLTFRFSLIYLAALFLAVIFDRLI